jgi:4-hydroxy-4-methyl-2-oxoglutarate aldolase
MWSPVRREYRRVTKTSSLNSTNEWKNDAELFRILTSELYTPVVGDILDTLGEWHRFLPSEIRPMMPTMKLAGRAMPVQIADVWGHQKRPFGRLTEALDQIEPGEIYLATGGTLRCAAWGEILTATARVRGGAGAIVDAFHRDTPRVLEQNWPVFSRGAYAQDAGVRATVVDFGCRIEIGGVTVDPGDLVFGDLDGVVVVPKHMEDEVIRRSLEKARGEKVVREAIEKGLSSTDAFKKYGIL